MIVYVDIEHARVRHEAPMWHKHLRDTLDIKYKLERLSGDHCLIMRYEQVAPAALQQLNARAVLVSGNVTEFQHYDEADLAGLRAAFRQCDRPTIGFCGGAMMIAETFGARAAAIEANATGDMRNGKWKERKHEWGFTPVQQIRPHPLFAGLDSRMMMMEAHYWEIKSIPAGFDLFASTPVTEIQFLAHQTLPLFATQFHPECFDDTHQDGRVLLKNFFALMQP